MSLGLFAWYGLEPSLPTTERGGFPRGKPAAFCQTARCLALATEGGTEYEVDGLLGPAVKVSFRAAGGDYTYCPTCDYAVFWSNYYQQRGRSYEIQEDQEEG